MEPGALGRTAAQRDLVRRGYDAIPLAYRSDDGQPPSSSAEDVSRCVQADMTEVRLRPGSVDAVVSFYALIHVPLEDQRTLFPRIRSWLRDGGYLPAITGADRWTGTESYLGAEMFWELADTATYLRWLTSARREPVWRRYIPAGDSRHTLVLARAAG